MFYCDACGKKRRWPVGLIRSNGRCEVCGKARECSDVPSSKLPEPAPKLHNDLESEVPPFFENPDFERFHRD
jgi:hypothetical protein